jgi:release factor glutamine methyltransferase
MQNPLTVDGAMAQARSRGIDRLDAQLMLGALLERPRSWLIAHGETALATPHVEVLRRWVDRRANGEPLAYLLGRKEFHGLTLQVDPTVLIPRPETELLVEWGLSLLRGALGALPAPQVVDLGTGSGAIALAIKHAFPKAIVTAVDASAAALATACRNSQSLNLPIELRQGNWWRAVAERKFSLALSNPPYIASGDHHLAALGHEPQTALVADEAGLGDLDRIIAGACEHLAPGGWLLLEHGHDQGSAVRRRLATAGFIDVKTLRDLAGHERCSGGRSATA